MKRSERLMFLAGVLCAACAVTFGVVRTKEQKEKIKNSDAVILTIPADTVTALSWETGTENLSFHKEEMWTYDEDAAFPVDEEKIGELLEIFEEFGVSFVIEDVEDYGQYGLDDPEGTIRLEAGEESYEILLGDFSAMDSERYVSIGDGNAYLVKEDPMDSFNIGLSSVIKNDQVPAMDQVERIRFTGPEAYEIFYEEDSTATYSPGDIYFTSRDEKTLPLDTSRVTTYLIHGTVIQGSVIPAMIDELPTVALMACFAQGRTVIKDAAELRVKESNRIALVAENLRAMGADVTETDDGMIIDGGRPLHGASISAHKDHRLAMTFAVAALAAEGSTELQDADCVSISYPDFYTDLKRLVRS